MNYPGLVSVIDSDGTMVLVLTQPVNAPAEVIWQVMCDHPGYADVADNISKVELLTPEGPQMRRACSGPKGERWEETCDYYEDGTAFGFHVHTDAADYPYPFSLVAGRWRVLPALPHAPGGFQIEIAVTPSGAWLQKFMIRTLGVSKFRKILISLGRAWAARMETEARGLTQASRSGDAGSTEHRAARSHKPKATATPRKAGS